MAARGENLITAALAKRGFAPTFIQRPLVPEIPLVASGWYVEAKSLDDEIVLTAPTVKGILDLMEMY